ncbi:hypothetical protein [Natronococcus wangiae]|uniref:hypothetical protein n=1 Tax=Natronococcus wangiae TaxID=3068275 RepID=UPI00273EF9B7|nr:hypothetical protein [Natronococcus sp. AD5]
MTTEHDRRRFLRLTGTGTAAALAGCADINPLSDDGDVADDVLTAVVGPDAEEIEALHDAIESDEMDLSEAERRQEKLIEDAVEDFESRTEDDSDLTVEESTREIGLYRIDGAPEAILGALREGPVTSLSGAAAYDQILEDYQQQSETEPGGAPGGEEPGEEDAGGGEANDGEDDAPGDGSDGNEGGA